jgi:protein TonB
LDPAYLHNPAPAYPALSKRNRETGTVLLLVNVSPEGNATSVTLHQSSGYDRLDQAASQAVTRWRFVPGMRGQSAISATVIVPISFKQP